MCGRPSAGAVINKRYAFQKVTGSGKPARSQGFQGAARNRRRTVKCGNPATGIPAQYVRIHAYVLPVMICYSSPYKKKMFARARYRSELLYGGDNWASWSIILGFGSLKIKLLDYTTLGVKFPALSPITATSTPSACRVRLHKQEHHGQTGSSCSGAATSTPPSHPRWPAPH